MRFALTLAVVLALNLAGHAQNPYLQGSGMPAGMKMEDDNDPFVPNAFVGSFVMESHSYKDGVESKHSPSTIQYWSSEDMTLIKMPMPGNGKGDMRMLTDLKGKWSYMLMDNGKGSKTAMKSKKKKFVMDGTKAEQQPEITVTDETRTIDGHVCTKVIAKTAEGTWTGWVVKDLKAPFGDMVRSMRTSEQNGMTGLEKIEGFPMEYEYVATNGDKVVCFMKEVKAGPVDASVFSLEGYTVMEMPGMDR